MTGKKLQRVLACLLAVLLLSQVGAFSPAVFAADDIDYTLQNGTAIIKSTMTTDEVNHALTRALVKDFDQKSEEEQSALLDSQTGLKWEYKCEGKSKSFLGISATHTDWGSINGFTSVDNRINFTHPALKDNKDGSYQVRVADTTAEVTLTKAEKLSSSITLKQDASVKLPYKEDGTLDFDALRAAILQQVVDEGTTPSLTTENTEIKYYATSSTGWAHEWVKLDGDKVNLATYPAISAGEQQIQISFKGFRPSAKAIGRIYTVGLPSIAMQCVGSLMTFGMNLILMAFSATAVAVFGVYFKLQSFVFMPIFGLNNGMVPIIGYNYGARRPDRVKKTIKLAVCYAEGIMLVGFCIFQFAPGLVLSIFAASDAMLAIGIPAMRIICLHFLLAGVSIVLSSVFQALGNGIFSLIVSVCRQLFVLLPAAWLLAQTGNVNNVWWAFLIAEVVSILMSLAFYARINKTTIAPLYH